MLWTICGGSSTIEHDGAAKTMELETITKVPVDRLRLDRESPRLAGEAAEALDGDFAADRSMGRSEANVFPGARVWRFEEHDFCFAV